MYESPINLLMSNFQTQIIEQQEEAIYNAVFDIGVNVTKDELLRALAYDRQQYEIGFAEGMAAAKPKWIPVTERLPEEPDRYLCNVKSFAFKGAYYQTILKYDRCGFIEGYIYTDDVTHWMPLPQPPKGE